VKYVVVGGSFEAGWDGQSCVVLRQRNTTGPNFHLTRKVVLELLGQFPPRGGRGGRDELVVFEVFNGRWHCGSVSLRSSWSEGDVLTELRRKGYPLDESDGHVAVFKSWPTDREFTMAWGEAVFRFAVRSLVRLE
jgi:hypothetical protein